MHEIKVGDNLGRKNKVLDIIGGPGQSGMGIVYICYNVDWSLIVAIKTFQNRFFSSLDVYKSFKLEALAWINLERHAFIVNALMVEDINDRPYLYLEYIAPDKLGRNTLTHYLKSPVSLKEALKWGIQFCHAMEHSISHGVSPHRDIKPDNIMITSYQDLKITDFGLAKLWNKSNFIKSQLPTMNEDLLIEKMSTLSIFKSSKNLNIVGTPPWMAPEQFEGVANIRSDIYSFGVVLYQMMNHGKLPFISNTFDGYKMAHQNHPLPQIESSLFPIVEKCLTKFPEDRYHNFKDLRLTLEELYKKDTGEYININPDDINIEFNEYEAKGLSLYSLGFYDEALQEYNKALTLRNNDSGLLNNLGSVYNKIGLFDKAINVFNRAITLSPENEASYINMFGAYYKKAITMNNPSIVDEGKKFVDKVLELNPNNVDAQLDLALYIEMREKDSNNAINIFERLIKLDPNNPKIFRLLGIKYREKGRISEAFYMFKKSVELNPLYEKGLYSLGLLYGSNYMFDQALPIFQKLMSINPSNKVYRENVEQIQSYKKSQNSSQDPNNRPFLSAKYIPPPQEKKKKKRKSEGKKSKR